MRVITHGFDDVELAAFRSAQRASFTILDEVAARLRPGMSERAATTLMLRAFRQRGVRSFFHLPVALFGERTALPTPWSLRRFWPTSRRLRNRAGDPRCRTADRREDRRCTSRSFGPRRQRTPRAPPRVQPAAIVRVRWPGSATEFRSRTLRCAWTATCARTAGSTATPAIPRRCSGIASSRYAASCATSASAASMSRRSHGSPPARWRAAAAATVRRTGTRSRRLIIRPSTGCGRSSPTSPMATWASSGRRSW